MTELTVETFNRMLDLGLTYSEMEAKTGISRNVIARFAQTHGIGPGKPTKGTTGKMAKVGATRIEKCQWIEGNPSHDEACKCGEPVGDKRPYCDRHWRRAFVPGTAYKSQRKGTSYEPGHVVA